jgi:hypothetical protein
MTLATNRVRIQRSEHMLCKGQKLCGRTREVAGDFGCYHIPCLVACLNSILHISSVFLGKGKLNFIKPQSLLLVISAVPTHWEFWERSELVHGALRTVPGPDHGAMNIIPVN